MSIRAISIPFDLDEPVEIIEIPKEQALQQLQQLVDGDVQCVPLSPAFDETTFWVNEDGKARFPEELGHNRRAQQLWNRAWGELTDFIVGGAVVLGGADEIGDTLGLNDEQYTAVLGALGLELIVKIENVYDDGHCSERTIALAVPEGDLDDWWQDEVFDHTGDGHGAGSTGSCLTATVVGGPTSLLGMSNEWID